MVTFHEMLMHKYKHYPPLNIMSLELMKYKFQSLQKFTQIFINFIQPQRIFNYLKINMEKTVLMEILGMK